jgi:tol-pal system protein YbgF
MLRFGFPFLFILSLLGGCAKPTLPDPRLGELEERVRRSEEQLAIARTEVTSLQERIGNLQHRVTEAEAELKERPLPAPTAIEEQPPVPPSAPAREATLESPKKPQPPDGSKDYERALGLLLKENDPERARKAFQSFLQVHRGHELEPNAVYWFAETYYVEKRFPEAILAFKEVVDRFPTHPKAADALLKIGYAYQGLGDTMNARFYLKMLMADYPKSEAAQKGRNVLDKLGG